MKTNDQMLLEKAYFKVLKEQIARAEALVQKGILSKEDFDAIVSIDKTRTKKYVGWMTKQWTLDNVSDIDILRNTIEEFDSFVNRGKVKNKDIESYKTFNDLKKIVSDLNESGEGISVKDLESDYDVVKDDENLLIMCPHTHEASRKLGLSYFSFRDCGNDQKDSSWCTTYKAPDHFNDYYYARNVTFYYVKVKSEELIKRLEENGFGSEYTVVAVAVLDQETSEKDSKKGYANMDAYDGNDKQFKDEKLKKYLSIIGV
jgi:hypothetical protein